MSEPLRLRVLTYNIHRGAPIRGPRNLAATAEAIREAEADLCALQEVLRLPVPLTRWDQSTWLSRQVGLQPRFRPSLGWIGYGFGNAILSRGRPASFRRYRLPGSGEPRSLLEARYPAGEHPLWFLNTHLALSPQVRALQAEAVVERVRSLDGPTILCGDWNCGADSTELCGLADAGLQLAGPGHCTYPAHDPRHCIDHIAVSSHFQVVACRPLAHEASDHLPLVADLILNA